MVLILCVRAKGPALTLPSLDLTLTFPILPARAVDQLLEESICGKGGGRKLMPGKSRKESIFVNGVVDEFIMTT